MKIAKDEKQKMKEFFDKRTKMHIGLVKEYAKKIVEYKKELKDLLEQVKTHDQSKFEDPEYDPYLYITWSYKCKDEGVDWEPPKGTDEKMNIATEHHVKNNRHHPEFHCVDEVDLINRKDRDSIPDKIIDGTKMNDIDIAEMVADWCAVSKEKGNTPQSWADKNVNKRWKFTEKQKDLIYELMDAVWE